VQSLFDASLWLAVAISLPLSLMAPIIIDTLFGGQYAEAGRVLVVLAWMPVWVFFGMARQRWLLAENSLRAGMAVEIAACGLNVLGNLILIPRYGALGSAMAAVIAAAGSTALLAPFSPPIRASAWMLLTAVLAPARMIRLGWRH
jgi:O-antigen/teichoic acid export membrane protein